MLVWLAKLKLKVQKPLLELFGQPRTCGEAANEKHELLMINQERCPRILKYSNRVDEKASPEVTPDGVHRGLNRGLEVPRNLCAVHENVSAQIH